MSLNLSISPKLAHLYAPLYSGLKPCKMLKQIYFHCLAFHYYKTLLQLFTTSFPTGWPLKFNPFQLSKPGQLMDSICYI